MAEYCRIRGVKVYLALNTLVTDREFDAVLARAREGARLGADAIIVADLGLVRALRQALPDTPLHASTQMSLHSLEGVRLAAAMGLTRAVLARELPASEIETIAQNSPIETEVFVHGALCMSCSGQCYMSAVIGRRSGYRGMCAQPCRLPYSAGTRGAEYPLSLKDNALAAHLDDLERIGVTCVKIEGRMKRPEYTAIVTGIYAGAAHERKQPTAEDLRALETAFSRGGFTDGYFTDHLGADMFGVRGDEKHEDSELFRAARRAYMHGELQRVPVRFTATVKSGKPSRVTAEDDRAHSAAAEGSAPEPAFHRELTGAILTTQLHKTGGTPFYCEDVRCAVDPGLSLPVAAVNEMRREVLTELLERRRELIPPAEGAFEPGLRSLNREEPPVFTVSVRSAAQLSKELLDLKPALLYIPAEELSHAAQLKPFLDSPDTTLAVALPRVLTDAETPRVLRILEAARKIGFTDALCGNLGQIIAARTLGFNVRGDFGLNVYNSQAIRAARDLGLTSVTLSFEMSLPQIRDAAKPIDTEIIAYGRLPLMLTENCVIKLTAGCSSCENFGGISDRLGVIFPIVRESKCRNVVLNSKKLFLADRLPDIAAVGLWGARLMFTTENARECADVFRAYRGEGDYSPGGFTRGLYYKGVF
ncbi:MAG: U32 family peptidase [Oscillospiraceae bacterium]|nr:U32 family peptidase [Oscillospiraceae bacterium]